MTSYDFSIEHLRAAVDWNNYDDTLRTGGGPPTGKAADYLAALIDECLTLRATLPPQTSVYRARIHPPDDQTATEPLPFSEMGAPPATVSRAGRLNAQDAYCLYAGLEENTAIAEQRPWVMARLSVANFLLTEAIQVVDLADAGSNRQLSPTLDYVRHMLGRPVHRDDADRYLGTQHLAGGLRSRGVDGVLYPSYLRADGSNLALFHEPPLKGIRVALHVVTSVKYKTSVLSTPAV